MKLLLKLDAGGRARDISREHGVSVRTLYRWRADLKVNRQPTPEQWRLLELEHQQLKERFAELVLDYTTLRAALVRDVKGDC